MPLDYFDQYKIEYEYEVHSFVLLPSFDFAAFVPLDGKRVMPRVREITYTPDFVGKDWVIETKGMKTPDFLLKWKLFKRYLTDNNLSYTLYMPSNQKQVRLAVEHILGKPIPVDIKKVNRRKRV